VPGEAENIALVRRFFELYEPRGDRDALFALLSPDIEMEPDPRHPRAGTHRGHDDYRAFLDEFEEPFEQTRMEPERVFARGDAVVAFVHTRRRPYGSSVEIENRIGFYFTISDGLIVREEVFGEREKALAAAGLTEADETRA
jgi:ketosteroid isomerase-like protein